MEPLHAYRLAVAELGNALAEKLCAFIHRRFGLKLEPRFIPLYRATLRDQEGAQPAPKTRQPTCPTISAGSRRFQEVRQLALDLLRQHGLDDWRFAYNRRKQAMGLCVYHRRTIELSIHFVEYNGGEEILDTILHEIAHALVGPGHGHDAVWKRKCKEIGAKPMRCGEADMPAGRWQACCKSCGKQFHRHRKPKSLRRWYCRDCGPEQGKLQWREAAA
jgi:predicted SprT family Zn-dependent metalloprotease